MSNRKVIQMLILALKTHDFKKELK